MKGDNVETKVTVIKGPPVLVPPHPSIKEAPPTDQQQQKRKQSSLKPKPANELESDLRLTKMSVLDLISAVKEHFEETKKLSREDEGGGELPMNVESLALHRGTRVIKFFGHEDTTKQKKIRILKESLETRTISGELRKNPPPKRYNRPFDLQLADTSKFRRALDVRRGSRVTKMFPPIDILVVPEFEEGLPSIGQIRRKELTCIPDHELAKGRKMVFPKEENVRNPFFIPKDIPAFLKRTEEARLKKRQADLTIPTINKQNTVSQIVKQIAERIKPYQTSTKVIVDINPTNSITWEAMNALNITHLQKVARKVHANYMTHRRNVFYMEYAIYARHKALQIMRDQEEAEEIGLRNYEYLSSYTTESLDVFLKDNDDSSSKASKAAEEKMKENLVLTQEVRNLRLETSSLKNEISSLNESLRECKYYMKFLDGVARELMRRDEEDAYRIERRQLQIKEEIARYTKQGMTLKQAQKAIKEKNKEYAGVQKKHHKNKNLNTESAEFIKELYEEAQSQAQKSPAAARISSMLQRVAIRMRDDDDFDPEALLEELDLVGGDDQGDQEELSGLVFTKPSQLLDIYVEVEEQNLSLIQHAQINEEVLEAVEHRIQGNRKDTENRSRELRDMINFIESQTQITQERIQTLNLLIDMFTGGYYDVKSQEKMMKLLRKHVNKVYKTSVGANDAHLSSVLMLTSIEKNFEDVVRDLESMPSDVVLKISRDLEKERRESERMEFEHERQKHREERIAKNLARNRAPVKQKRGRPLAFRSKPPKLAVHLTQQDLDKKAEEDEYNYYFGE